MTASEWPNEPDSRTSARAMSCAVEMARKTGIRTATSSIVLRDGKPNRISAEMLHRAAVRPPVSPLVQSPLHLGL
jgi:hypothetical protein